MLTYIAGTRELIVLVTLLMISSCISQKIQAQDYNLTVVTDESQRHGSHLTDYLVNILDESKLNYEQKIYPWARALNLAKSQKNVLIYGLARTKAREQQFIWFHEATQFRFYLYGLKSRQVTLANDEQLFRTYKVGVIRDDITHQELAAHNYSRLVPANSEQQLINLLNKGRVDFICTNQIILEHFSLRELIKTDQLFEATEVDFLRTPIYFALSKNTDQQIIDALKSGLSKARWIHE